MRKVWGTEVHGVDVDEQTRCGHWNSKVDIIAIKFKCCGKWYPCYECHEELAEHLPLVWSRSEFDEDAVLCGSCGYQLSIDEYVACDSRCTKCGAQFNPGCANHYALYFDTGTVK